jgi:hypothetical protein
MIGLDALGPEDFNVGEEDRYAAIGHNFEFPANRPLPNQFVTIEFVEFCGLPVPPCCSGDSDSNGAVNFADVTSTLAHFAESGTPGLQNPGDADCSGTINFADITSVLSNWGEVCP